MSGAVVLAANSSVLTHKQAPVTLVPAHSHKREKQLFVFHATCLPVPAVLGCRLVALPRLLLLLLASRQT
jgi:hypothetical protein